MTEKNVMAFMPKKKTVLAAAIAATLSMGLFNSAVADTSTTAGSFIMDRIEVKAGDTVNLSLLGLDKDGKVDQFGESSGAEIYAVVNSLKGKVRLSTNEDDGNGVTSDTETSYQKLGTVGGLSSNAATVTDTSVDPSVDRGTQGPSSGNFAASVRYVKLTNGLGAVHIYYEPTTPAGEDTVTVTLQESFKNADGGVTTKVIESATKTVKINPRSSDTTSLNIMSFSDSDLGVAGEDSTFSDGVNGRITAGKTGATVVVNAYKDNGAMDTAATGTVTLNLRPNREATPQYSFTGEMKNGTATITFDTSGDHEKITKERDTPLSASPLNADFYYMEATMPVGTDADDNVVTVNSIDMSPYAADTLRVADTGKAVKLKLSELYGRTRVSKQNAQPNAGTLVVEYLDEYGNKTTGPAAGATVSFDDTNDLSFTDTRKVTFTNSKSSLSLAGSDIKTGEASFVASIADQTAIAPSEPFPLTIKTESLIANHMAMISGNANNAQQAGSSFLGFDVRIDGNSNTSIDGNGSFDSTDTAFSKTTAVEVTNRVEINGKRETSASTVLITGTDAGKAKVKYKTATDIISGTACPTDTRWWVIGDTDGDYGQTAIDTSTLCVKQGEVSQSALLNGHYLPVSSLSPVLNDDDYDVTVNNFNLYVMDANGNFQTAGDAGTVVVSSSNGEESSSTPFDPATNTGSVTVSYPTKGSAAFSGEDTIELKFSEPDLTGSVKTTIPALAVLDTVMMEVEDLPVPANGEIAVTILTKDQNGDSIQSTGDNAVSLTISGDVIPTVTNIAGTTTYNTGSKVDTGANGRLVMKVAVGQTTGTFKLRVASSADGEIFAEKEFTVSANAVVTCAAGAEANCKTETECTGVNGEWDANANSCKASTTTAAPDDLGGSAANPDGSPLETTTKFTGGVSIEDGAPANQATIKETDEFKLTVVVDVDDNHVGLEAEVVQVALFAELGKFFMNTADGWKEWNLLTDEGALNIGGLEPSAPAAALVDPLTIDVYQGSFEGLGFAGLNIWVYAGYMVTDTGALVFSGNPVKIKVDAGE